MDTLWNIQSNKRITYDDLLELGFEYDGFNGMDYFGANRVDEYITAYLKSDKTVNEIQMRGLNNDCGLVEDESLTLVHLTMAIWLVYGHEPNKEMEELHRKIIEKCRKEE